MTRVRGKTACTFGPAFPLSKGAFWQEGRRIIPPSADIDRKIIDVLLVEDNADEAELTLQALRENSLGGGNNIHVCRDGQEALDFLFSTGQYAARKHLPKPKLVLLDIKLPLVSGLEVLDQVKKNEELRHIPIIVLTAARNDKDVDTCYDLGVNSYIEKPVDFDAFREVMRTMSHYWLRLNQLPDLLGA